MKIGIMLSTNDPETVWNAFRFGVTSLKEKHSVNIFLINRGVEAEEIKDAKYNVCEQIDLFVKNNGHILACGTCLKSRHKEGNNICPISTMQDLLKMVEDSDKILSFG